MFYVGYQITPLPGKLDALLELNARARRVADAHGAKQVGGFQVSVGQGTGSLLYIVGYPDADAYQNSGKALEDEGLMKEQRLLSIGAESAILHPLQDSSLQ